VTAARNIAIDVVNLTKRYGSVTALRSVSLQIASGEYFVLLGPSGGGKTTLLRLIGGFLKPTAGTISLHGVDVSNLPPNKRPTSMMFQSYALFPHMSVERNVGYGLRLQRMKSGDIRDKVNAMLKLVGMNGLNERMPHELSGGQQQRVQLARSLVLDSDILLLDEPLASLDAKLRKDMCLELKHIQEQVGITFLHVTHNQEEAMTVADHIAIIADGNLVESATPRDIYLNPRARYTAEFIGENNLLQGRVVSSDRDETSIDLGHATVRVHNDNIGNEAIKAGADVSLSIPSEKLFLVDRESDNLECLPATFVERLFLGLTVNDRVRLADGTDLQMRSLASDTAPDLATGDKVTVAWKRGDARLHTF
jgi:ABC-type Fe3+/spermidine/putrescine transport system ATPase subunit